MRLRHLLPIVAFLAPAALHGQHALGGEGPYDPEIPTPGSVLGYELGETFTPHAMIVRYASAVAEASDRVTLDTVATTWEGRPVLLLTVTSASNQARIDEIRAGARRLADPRGASDGELDALVSSQPTAVWLGYTVHGDEASGVEAALGTLYQLAAGQDPATLEILDNVVALIDPVENPDGHDRHVNQVAWDRGRFGPDPYPRAVVHGHDWHGGRTNHYLFDLNRDWIVHAHPETRGRMAYFREWFPHVAADLHEMGSSSTYFFAPPMQPVNANVHPLIREGWQLFARGNAAAFAANGWGFFTKEGYDEFFPGYGPSWPLYTGAVGMTYEQGSSEGGAVERDDGSVLTLREAAMHHYAASIATLRTAATNRGRRVGDYLEFRRDAIRDNAGASVRSIVLERDGQGRADSMVTVLLRHGIEVGRVTGGTTIGRATAYGETVAGRVQVDAGAYVVDLSQPQGTLARTLLEPDPAFDPAFIDEELARREAGQGDRFYDMTGWALPFLFRVRAWHTAERVGPAEPVTDVAAVAGAPLPGRAGYAYVFEPGGEASIRMLGGLLARGVRVRHATGSFRVAGDSFDRGAYVVLVHRNRGDDDGATLHETVRTLAAESGARVVAIGSALVDQGTDLGSNSVEAIPIPEVALLAGDAISSYSYGAAWYAFDQLLHFPVTRIEADALTRSLSDFNVVVIPSAFGIGSELGERGTEALRQWVRDGGTLITLDAATSWLASEDGLARLRPWEAPDDAGERILPASVPGAVLRAEVDRRSPLLAGIDQDEIPVMLFGSRLYEAPDDVEPGEAVIRYTEDADRLEIAGYLWPELPERIAGTTYLWTEGVGAGRIIAFTGDPNFRAMWRGLLPLFANAVFLGGTF
jgi:hypothetical protein